MVVGVELDADRARRARWRLATTFGRDSPRWRISTADALTLPDRPLYDAVVGNPPYRRLHYLNPALKRALRREFKTAVGMFDLSYVFVEKAVRLLRDGGEARLVLQRGISTQPAAAPLRAFLAEQGESEFLAGPDEGFEEDVEVYPCVLRFRKSHVSARRIGRDHGPVPVLGDIADVSPGVATGANHIFLIDAKEAAEHGLEPGVVRSVIRGRDATAEAKSNMRLICPYEVSDGRARLLPLSRFRRTWRFLGRFRDELIRRPRLTREIAVAPRTWYRFIDHPASALRGGFRVVLPDVFRDVSYRVLTQRDVVVLNSAFIVTPKRGVSRNRLLHAIESATFRQQLAARSRPLRGGYHRTSCTELRTTPIEDGGA